MTYVLLKVPLQNMLDPTDMLPSNEINAEISITEFPIFLAAARRRTSSKPVILTEAQKQLMVHKLPQVLRLHLKRFRYDKLSVCVARAAVARSSAVTGLTVCDL